jgi:hypothetical protein
MLICGDLYMIKLEYGLCVIMLSKCICDPMTQHVNWEYRTAWSSKQMHIQKYISFPDWALRQHHLLRRNGAAKSSDSLAIKILPRRINCNSLFIAYNLLTCLWEHQLGKSDIQDHASWYIFIMKANEMHYFSYLFDKVLYMFWTGPLSIIRSISMLYTHNRYCKYLLHV